MSSRIEQIIEEIEEYIDRDCKFQPLSTTKIIVNKEHLDELLRELRMKTPDEIKRYQKIIANRDAILEAMRAFEKDLAHFRGLIESRDAEGLMEVFGRASQARRGLFPSAGALQGRAAEEKKNA